MDFDLAILGSGSGNTIPGRNWEGRSIALIDSGTFGGTCLNVGCIPTKMFVHPADIAASARNAGTLGVDATIDRVRWRKLRDRIFGRIDPISANGRDYRRTGTPGLTLFEEEARFTGPRTLRTASGTEIAAEQIVVAAGSRVVTPDFPGRDLPQIHTSDTVMRIAELPRHVVIVGGGYVAAEFAHIFSGLGSSVTQVTRSARLLKGHDDDIAQRFAAAAARQWNLLSGYEIEAVEQGVREDVRVRLRATAPGKTDRVLEASIVLLATGRTPNTDRMDAQAAGFDVEDDGRLATDAYQRVLSGGHPVTGVWSLGDISNVHQLKHVANHEARVVAHNLLHPDDLRASDSRVVPSAVFSRPQIATVGMTEREATAHAARTGSRLTTVIQDYGTTAYGWAMEDTEGIVKLIADRATGQLLGAHILGHEASLLLQPLIQAMSFGLDARTMAGGQYWIHPALTEVVENALLALDLD